MFLKVSQSMIQTMFHLSSHKITANYIQNKAISHLSFRNALFLCV